MALKINTGSITNDARCFYGSNKRNANILMNIATLKLATESKKLYTGATPPFLTLKLGSKYKFGAPLRVQEGYLALAYDRDDYSVKEAYVVTDEGDNKGLLPIFTIEQTDAGLLNELSAEASALKLVTLFSKATKLNDVTLDEFNIGMTEIIETNLKAYSKVVKVAVASDSDKGFDEALEEWLNIQPKALQYFIVTVGDTKPYFLVISFYKERLYNINFILRNKAEDKIELVNIDAEKIAKRIFDNRQFTDSVLESTNPYVVDDNINHSESVLYTPIGFAMERMGLTSRQAGIVMENAFVVNPFMELHNIQPYMYSTEEAYDKACVDMFINALESTGYNMQLFEEALAMEDLAETATGMVNKAKEVGSEAKKKLYAGKKAIDAVVAPIMKSVTDLFDSVQKNRDEESREIVISDSFFLKVRRIFKYCIAPPYIALILKGPLFAIITGLVGLALKSDDDKTHGEVIRELEMELKLTREKIEDARSHGETTKKYELMRIESKLENEIARIKFGKKD